jgi:hypothetical protein
LAVGLDWLLGCWLVFGSGLMLVWELGLELELEQDEKVETTKTALKS